MLKLLSAKVFEIRPKFAKAIAKTSPAVQPQNRSWDARFLAQFTLTITSLGYPYFLCKCSTVLEILDFRYQIVDFLVFSFRFLQSVISFPVFCPPTSDLLSPFLRVVFLLPNAQYLFSRSPIFNLQSPICNTYGTLLAPL
jgi:hypothetical protein